MVVAGDKGDNALNVLERQLAAQQGGQQTFDQQAGGGRIAVMHFIAHMQRLRHQRFQLQLAQLTHGGFQRRGQLVAHPVQTV
ncbi:hypothetical protein D3C80_1990580 [compost metagenome]